MSVELEYKLGISDPRLLEQILFDPQVAEIRQGNYVMIHMATVYYDTPDKQLSARRWTLRLRQENDRLVATLKTPAQGRARGEFECPADSIQTAIPLLLEAGAPEELSAIVEGQPLLPTCAAQFTRRVAPLSFADGTVCELCGDVGTLVGGTQEEDFCELELELKSGSEETVGAFAGELMDRFDLSEETRSKFARAAALANRGNHA